MSQYTELLSIEAETLSPEDDDYEKKLLEISTLFRGFGESLTAFIQEHGYIGRLSDVEAKTIFLCEKFKAADIKPPRDVRDWFVSNKKIARKTAFQICFAFKLGIAETNYFFRCVQFERGFDCHTISEVVYYFCIKNGLSYSEAQEIIAQIPVPKKVKVIANRQVLYTGTIVENVDNMNDKQKLIQYITSNINDFEYNNATAIKYIHELWSEISGKDGLAVKEGTIIDRFNRYEDKQKKNDTDTRSAEVIADEIHYQQKIVQQEDSVIARQNSSTWTIFCQIIGLSNYTQNEYATKYDRSISSVLSGNALLPLNASYCFPSQKNIDELLRGEPRKDELVRKMLIFLSFYAYWAKIIVKNNNAQYIAKYYDSERCSYTINKYLLDAGYPELYAGNPYDWLFMWSLNDEHPLDAFRAYIGDVFTSEDIQSDIED